MTMRTQLKKVMINIYWQALGVWQVILDRLRFTFTPNGEREFVPRDQVFPLIVANCLLLQLTNKKFSRRFYS